ncbi:hypothetical protein BC829DRAFT_397278 [Chytridium lagenaria]|nr:hypothetical protein BC829DRAFT_397278 [Chytridium lagenaria]
MLDRWRRTVLGPKGIDPGSIPVDTKVSGLPVMPVPKSYFLDLNVESREVAKQQKAEEEGHDTPDNQQQPVDDHVPNRLARRSGGRPDLEMKFIDDDDQFEDLKVSPIVITYAIRKAYSMSEPLYEEDDAEHHDRTDERDSPEALESPSPSINTTLHRRSASAPHPASRGSTIKNERELIERIRRAVSFWSTPESGRRANVNIRFRAVDFATLAVEDQVALAQDTDVLIGAHGGVLVNLIYLRAEPVGGLLELKPARIKNKRLQYRNLAYQLGFRYDAVSIGQSYVHNLDLVVRRLRQLVVEVYRIRRNGMLANQASLTYTPPESDEKAW